ncbi:MAG: hypothetical protein ACKVP3_15410 [Hyphomicrobiaceae bacterium]
MEEARSSIAIRIVRAALLAAAIAFAAINGTYFSPVFDSIFFLLRPFSPAIMSFAPNSLLHFTSLLIFLVTLAVSGVPAAVYERIRGLPRSTVGSLLIWAIGAFVLAYPALQAMAGRD